MTIVIFEYVKTRAIAYGTCENEWMSVAWDDLRTVLMLARHRTLAGAAKATGVNYTTVARRVRRAEEANGSRGRQKRPPVPWLINGLQQRGLKGRLLWFLWLLGL